MDGLTSVHKSVLYSLALRLDNATGQCWPSYETIARDAGIGVSTAKEAIAKLARRGLLSVTRRPIPGSREADTNLYMLSVPVVQEPDHVVHQLDEVVQEPDHRGPGARPRVVQQLDGGGPAAGPKLPSELPNRTPQRTREPLALTRETPARSSKPQPKSRVPGSDASEDELRSWCDRWQIPSPASDAESAKMIDYFRASGEAKVDWSATWRNWTRRAPEFRRTAPSGRRPLVQPTFGLPFKINLAPSVSLDDSDDLSEAAR
jgi:hypothetical protein